MDKQVNGKGIMEISLIRYGDKLWDETIAFADNCSWKAGPFRAEKMRENAFRDQERVIVALEAGRIIGYCTFVMEDELPPECGYSPFIGFVFVDEKSRGKRVSGKMISLRKPRMLRRPRFQPW